MIAIHIEGKTMDEVKEQMRQILDHKCACAEKAEATPAPEAPKAEAKSEYDITVVRAACVAYKDKNGHAALKNVLAQFGAKGLPDVPAEKYGELMQVLQ